MNVFSKLRKHPYFYRWVATTLIYLFFKVTMSYRALEILHFTVTSIVYYVMTLIVVMTVWEVCEKIFQWHKQKLGENVFESKGLTRVFFFCMIAQAPILLANSYMMDIVVAGWMDCLTEHPYETFKTSYVKSMMVGSIITLLLLFKFYYEFSQQEAMDKEKFKRDAAVSKYESLKNQIDPHFLFNSFSVLTSLIHRNPDLASDFLSQLSKTYRYILDHKKEEIISLKDELEFMDAFLFLMNIRHDNCIQTTVNINVSKDEYYIPTLALQMLIDNSIKHNSFSIENPLKVEVYNEDEQYLVIKNNIQSCKEDTVPSTGTGLENIQNRYQFHTSKPVIIESGKYFIVKIPLLRKVRNRHSVA